MEDRWDWIRTPSGRALGDLLELTTLLQKLQPIIDRTDKWWCFLDDDGIFLVKKLKIVAEEKCLIYDNFHSETMWNNLVPIKTNILLWLVLHRRLLIRVAFDNRDRPGYNPIPN